MMEKMGANDHITPTALTAETSAEVRCKTAEFGG